WHRVLAATSREARSPADIAARTGVPEAEVGRCLDRLERDGLVDVVVFHPRPDAQAPAPRPGRWSGLAARVGLLLGFQR
ncbi:MarR family transcriptional regulator, partial [Arenimonas malthae]|uniref:MarR family transcriptional regulator n=1 Tax=Arenimonas malthae TaxID=354197 RepID=UPI0005C24149